MTDATSKNVILLVAHLYDFPILLFGLLGYHRKFRGGVYILHQALAVVRGHMLFTSTTLHDFYILHIVRFGI
jgi:hypothetical protein